MSLLDVNSDLRHFLVVTYAVPPEKVEHFLEGTNLKLNLREIDGKQLALLSVVNFLDSDFHFKHLPLGKWDFFQTNYRMYVTENGKPAVWFFGTTLGSWIVRIPQLYWRLPWYPAKYKSDIEWEHGKCLRYSVSIRSDWADSEIDISPTGEPSGLLPGFGTLEEQSDYLLNPFVGYFRRTDGETGTYSVHHGKIETLRCKANVLKFSLLDRLGIVSNGDMNSLHSALLSRSTNFDVFLPPHKVPKAAHSPNVSR